MEAIAIFLQALGFGVTVGLVVAGILGVLLPLLPGISLSLLAIAGFAWLTEFSQLSIPWLAVVALIGVASMSADWWLPLLTTRASGAGRWSGVFGALGGIVGFFIFGLIGSIAGYALAVVLSEYRSRRALRPALKASLSGLAGRGVAAGLQFSGGVLMLVIFVWQVLGT